VKEPIDWVGVEKLGTGVWVGVDSMLGALSVPGGMEDGVGTEGDSIDEPRPVGTCGGADTEEPGDEGCECAGTDCSGKHEGQGEDDTRGAIELYVPD
jgi:hypothetical protein